VPDGNDVAAIDSIVQPGQVGSSGQAGDTSFADGAQTPTLESLQAKLATLEAEKAAEARRAETYRGNLESLRAKNSQTEQMIAALQQRIEQTEQANSSAELRNLQYEWKEIHGKTPDEIQALTSLYDREQQVKRREKELEQLKPVIDDLRTDNEIREYIRWSLEEGNKQLEESGFKIKPITIEELVPLFKTRPGSQGEIEKKFNALVLKRLKDANIEARKDTLNAREKNGTDQPVTPGSKGITSIRDAERAWISGQLSDTEWYKFRNDARKQGLPGYI